MLTSLNKQRGFTLVEVMVALLVIGLLAAGALVQRNQYLGEQYRAEQQFLAHTVAWNPLMEQYQADRGWLAANSDRQSKGRVEQWGRQWYWRLDSQPTLGEQFFRYETTVYELEGTSKPTPDQASAGSMTVYWIRE
jgi:type II secretion system protein I